MIRMTQMRRYFWRSALLYYATGIVLLAAPSRVMFAHSPLMRDDLRWAYALLFLLTAVVKTVAGSVLKSNIQIAAVAAGCGMATFWTLLTLANAVFFDGDIGRPILWGYIALQTYSVLPWAGTTKEEEEQLVALSKHMQATIEDIQGRINRSE